jgi:hypothetical protein
MALENEVASRQADVTATQQLSAQVTAQASALAQALTMANQFAATLGTQSEALTTLAAGVTSLASATSAIASALQIQLQCQPPALTFAPAEQAWNTAASLAAQRASWLLAHWQQTHIEQPPATAIAMADPLAQALSAYSTAAAQLLANIQAAREFAPAPAPAGTGGPAAVAGWLRSCAAHLTSIAAQITAATTQLGSTQPWAAVEATATTAITSVQAFLATAQQVAAALAGPVDPASLAALLADLTTLRVNACPDPIEPADRAIYDQRMAELVQALTGLLAAPTGAVAPTTPPATSPAPPVAPIALLPVRLETRVFPVETGGTEFRIRVYVDSVHVNAHDPRLTTDEALWAAQLQTATAGGATLTAAEWAQVAALFGPARAAYLLNPEPDPGERTSYWAQAPTTMALPDCWLAIGYGPDGTAIGAALGSPITVPLQVGPDPTAAPSAASSDDLAVDPGMAWMINYADAVTAGMGLSLFVDGGAAGPPAAGATTGSPTLSQLLVVGVRTGDGTQALANLLNAHHYTSGLGLVSYGTPTNNTSDVASGFTSTDPGYAQSYIQEVLRPAVGGDATRLAAALGIYPSVDPAIFTAAAPAPLVQQQDQQAMTALTWPATWGSFLTGLAGMSAARAERLREWAVAWLRPGGPLPALRIGPRPYGILPIVDLGSWADSTDPAATDVHGVLTGLVGPWLAADPTAGNPDFDALLARLPVSAEAWGRFAGITPGWLQTGFDLGVANAQITASVSALPGLLTQIGAACGLAGPLTWPAGFLALPDPVAGAGPWPLVVPDGQMAWIPATDPPGAYLTALLAGSSTALPQDLLDFVASQSWAATPGAASAAGILTPRGNLGDIVPEPSPPAAASELHGAASYLAGRTNADLSSLLGGALDAAAHRLDAWVTALATRRLGQVRTSATTGIFLGGFSWVENLVARPPLLPVSVPNEPQALADPANAGYQQAPSIQQATTAAVLRSGYLTNNPLTPGAAPPAPGAPFAIDLSSRRARLATWLLDGVRQGQPLSVLLGYRFERDLQEASLGDLVQVFRQAAPYNPVTIDSTGTSTATPTEAAVPTDVVDGVALYQLAQTSPLPGPPTASQWTQAQPALTDLADAIDAVSDAVTAQGLHDLLTGSTFAVNATLDGVASGAVAPPELAFLNTTRTGIAVSHSVLVPIASGQPYPPAGWPDTPRGRAEPALTAWVAGLLGNPALVTAAVSLVNPAGAPLAAAPTTITLSSLGLGPLDVVALASQPAELENLAVYSVISALPATSPPAGGGTLDGNPAGAAFPLSAVLSVAQSASQLIGASRGADARDLAPAGTVTDPGADLTDLANRVSGPAGGPVGGVVGELTSAAAALSAALPGDPAAGSSQPAGTGIPAGANPAALAAALVSAVLLGVPAAAPAGAGAAALGTLVNQARGAWAEIVKRQAAIAALAPASTSTPDPATQLTALLGQLGAAFGGGFQALPLVTTSPPNLLAQAASLTSTATTDPSQEPDAWLVKASRVNQPVADLLDTCCGAEALGTGPPLTLTIGQVPLPVPSTAGATPSAVPWVGLPFTGSPPAAGSLSLAMLQAPPSGSPLSALLVANWVEVIPSQSEVTGLTYHYAAPDAQAPQSILIAVPADLSTTAWSYGDLVAAVASARELAHVRGVDYADLPGPARQVLPAAYIANAAVPAPGPWSPALAQLAVPGTYLTQTAGAIEITAVTVSAGSLEQAQTCQLTVSGQNFAPSGPAAPPPLPFSAFTVPEGGVTITAGTVTDSEAILSASVDPQAPTGLCSLSVGTFTLANCLTVAPQPRATGCDTTALSQQMTAVTQVITITGQALSHASISSTTGSSMVTWQLSSTGAAQVQVTASIAASSYEPYSDPTPAPGPVDKPTPVYRPPVHVSIGLTLTVTPAPGQAAVVFPITLDAIE